MSRGWRLTVRLQDIFHEDIPFEEKRDIIVSRLRESRWLAKSEDPAPVEEAIENLADSQSVEEFDQWWSQVYDYADYDRVWLATF